MLSTETRTTQSRCELLICSTYYLKIEIYPLYSIGNMACMKQTPRNPVLERPLTAMGIDVQEK